MDQQELLATENLSQQRSPPPVPLIRALEKKRMQKKGVQNYFHTYQ
jgi:hypothetical protein